MSSWLPKGRPISIYKHPKLIEPLGAKRGANARRLSLNRHTCCPVSVAPRERDGRVCRTYVCHVSCAVKLQWSISFRRTRLSLLPLSVCRSTNALQWGLKLCYTPTDVSGGRPTDVSNARSIHRRKHPRDRRENSDFASVCCSLVTASDVLTQKPSARV
jgi:hypothetical protein